MNNNSNLRRFDELTILGQSGRQEDVDILMQTLVAQNDLATSKLVDFALGLVQNPEGVERVRYYLFNGQQEQRNFAALHFKRKGHIDLLEEAVAKGKIDLQQAFAK